MSFCGWWAGTETYPCSASVQCFTRCSKQIKTGGSFWKPGNHYLGLKSQPFMAIGIYPTLDIITDHLCCSLCKFFSLYSCVLHSVRCDPIRAGAGALCWDVTEADNQRLLHNIATSHSHNLILWHTRNIWIKIRFYFLILLWELWIRIE